MNLSADAGDLVSIPRLGRLPGEGYAGPPQYSCLENLTDRGAYWAAVMGLRKSQTQPGTHTHTNIVIRETSVFMPSGAFSPTIHTIMRGK